MIEIKIIEFLNIRSKGLINLSITDAKLIVEMVKGKRVEQSAYVKVFRKNHANNTWEHERNISATDELVKYHVALALENTPPNENFYKYDCINSLGEYEGCVFHTSPNLFNENKSS